MFCTDCGNQVSDEAKFCPKCGSTINAKPQQVVFSNGEVQKESSLNKVKDFFIKYKVVFGVLIVVLAILGYTKFMYTDGDIKGTWQFGDESNTAIAEIKNGNSIGITYIDNDEQVSIFVEGKLKKENQAYYLNIFDSEISVSGPLDGSTKEEIILDMIGSDYPTEAYDYLYKNSVVKNNNLTISLDFSKMPIIVRKLVSENIDFLDSKMTLTFTPVNNNVLQVNLWGYDEETINLIRK